MILKWLERGATVVKWISIVYGGQLKLINWMLLFTYLWMGCLFMKVKSLLNKVTDIYICEGGSRGNIESECDSNSATETT